MALIIESMVSSPRPHRLCIVSGIITQGVFIIRVSPSTSYHQVEGWHRSVGRRRMLDASCRRRRRRRRRRIE